MRVARAQSHRRFSCSAGLTATVCTEAQSSLACPIASGPLAKQSPRSARFHRSLHICPAWLKGKSLLLCRFRTGSGAPAGAMASDTASRSFYKDDEILVDRDGVPHLSGAMPSLMKEYRRRVLLAYSNLEGSGSPWRRRRLASAAGS